MLTAVKATLQMSTENLTVFDGARDRADIYYSATKRAYLANLLYDPSISRERPKRFAKQLSRS